MLRLVVCVSVFAVGVAGPVAAWQEPVSVPVEVGFDVHRPMSIDRIKKRLTELPPYEQRLLRRRIERVNVYARKLDVDVFREFNVKSWASPLGGRTGGAIAYGAPTHNEMMRAMTPTFWQQAATTGAFSFGW